MRGKTIAIRYGTRAFYGVRDLNGDDVYCTEDEYPIDLIVEFRPHYEEINGFKGRACLVTSKFDSKKRMVRIADDIQIIGEVNQ